MATASKTITKSNVTFYTISVTVNISSQTDTQATLSWSSSVTFGEWYHYGVRLKTTVNGTQVGNKTGYTTSSYKTTCSGSGTINVAKGTSAKTVTFSAATSSETVSGYGGVGSTGTASGSISIAAGVFEYAPNNPTSCTITKNSDTSATLTWAFTAGTNRPITKQERALETNGSWGSSTAIANNTTKTADYTITTNSRYRGRVRLGNNTGWSAWVNSGYIYTTPTAPTAYGIQTERSVSLTAASNGARYFSAYEWAYSADGGTTWTTLTGTTANITHTATVDSPKYRVRTKNAGNVLSAWTTITPAKNPLIYVNVPTGSSISNVYVWKD